MGQRGIRLAPCGCDAVWIFVSDDVDNGEDKDVFCADANILPTASFFEYSSGDPPYS